MKEKILQLKKEKNAVILAHYYAPAEAQEVADYVGDSFYLAKIAKKSTADIIVFCGVSFMGESAKILNPDKKVLMPDLTADCPMAHMVAPGLIQKMREKYEDLAVVCYINSTAELKCQSDVCVTSSNAIKIVKALPNKNIFFIPDRNLGGARLQRGVLHNPFQKFGQCLFQLHRFGGAFRLDVQKDRLTGSAVDTGQIFLRNTGVQIKNGHGQFSSHFFIAIAVNSSATFS